MKEIHSTSQNISKLSRRKIYTYIVQNFTGFAPNYSHGCCTLATCKPAIRRTSSIGDIIVGINSKKNGHKILYWMRVDEKLTHSDYYTDKKFTKKIPNNDFQTNVNGDNIYQFVDGKYQQIPSCHSCKDIKKDLGGKYVLISYHYKILDQNPASVPIDLELKIPSRGHKVENNTDRVEIIYKFLQTLIF